MLAESQWGNHDTFSRNLLHLVVVAEVSQIKHAALRFHLSQPR